MKSLILPPSSPSRSLFMAPLLPRAMCLSRLRGTFVAFGLTWALVEFVNSLRTAEARAEARETIEYEPLSVEDRTLLACRGWAAAGVSCRHSSLQSAS